MPDVNSIKNAADRRAQRKAARDLHADQAAAEAVAMSKVTQKQNDDRKAGIAPVAHPASPAVNRKQAREIAKAKAEAEADRDVRVTAAPLNIEDELERYRQRGEPVPLHLLNAIAKADDTAVRDGARALANVVGKVAFETAIGRLPHLSRGKRAQQTDIKVAQRMAEGSKV